MMISTTGRYCFEMAQRGDNSKAICRFFQQVITNIERDIIMFEQAETSFLPTFILDRLSVYCATIDGDKKILFSLKKLVLKKFSVFILFA